MSDTQATLVLLLAWVLLRLFLAFILASASLLSGVLIGVILWMLNTPYWAPIPFLILTLLNRRIYPILFMLGIEWILLGVFH